MTRESEAIHEAQCDVVGSLRILDFVLPRCRASSRQRNFTILYSQTKLFSHKSKTICVVT